MAQYATLFSDEVEENPVVQDDGYTSLFADEAKEIAPVSQDAAQGASRPYSADGYDSLFSDEANLAGGGKDATAQSQPVYDGRNVGNAGAPMRPEDFAGEDSMGGMELLALRGQADGAPVAERADGSVSAWLKNLSLGVAHNSSGRVASRNIEMNLQDILRGTVRKDGKDMPLTELPDSELDYLVDAAGWNGAGAWFKRFLGPWARSDSGVMQDWDRTEGAKIADPSARKAARVRYAQEMARNITLQNERDKQAAQAELQGREKQTGAGFTAGLAQTGSYMLPFMIPGAHGVMAGLIGGADRGQEMASDRYEMDGDGNVRVAAERDSTGAAIAKGVARGIVEPLVETVGGTLATKALGGLAGATLGKIPLLKSVGGKIAETAVGKALSRYGKTMQRFGRATGLQGAPEETIEEFEDNILDAALGIDRRESEKQGGALQRAGEAAKDFFKPESLKNLAESMLLVQILGGGIAHVNDRYRSKPIDNILAESAGIDKGVLKDYTADEKWAAYEAYVNGLSEDEVKEKLGNGADAVNELADVIAKGTAEVDDFRRSAYAMMDEDGAKPENAAADAQMRQANSNRTGDFASAKEAESQQRALNDAAERNRGSGRKEEMRGELSGEADATDEELAAFNEYNDLYRRGEIDMSFDDWLAQMDAPAQNRAEDPVGGAGARGAERTGEEADVSTNAPGGAEAALEEAQAEPPPPEVVDRPNRLRRQQPNNFRHPGDNRLRPAVPNRNQQPIRETNDETGNGADEAPAQPVAQVSGRDGRQPPPEAGARPLEGAAARAEAADAGVVAPQASVSERAASAVRTDGANTKRGENLRGYSYEDYGAPPDVMRPGEGGTGDQMGAELLRFARDNGGILKIPPKGTPDPLADWIANFKDGGGRGDHIAIFGMRPRKGTNDGITEDMPSPLKEYVDGMIERDGPEAVADWFLETRRKYAEWAAGRRGAAREAREAAKVRAEEDAVYDYEGMSAARDGADAEWDGAIGEIEAGDPMFGATSEYVKPFSRENLRNAKQGDIIHFDHDKHSFALDAYDNAKGEVTLIDERDGVRRRFKVSKNGIREIGDGRRNEEVVDKDNAGDAGGGRRSAARAPGEAAGGERGGGEDFALESATAEELKAEKERQRQRDEVRRRQNAQLETGTGEVGQTLLDLGGAQGRDDLFNQTQSAQEGSSASAAPSAGNEAPKRLYTKDGVTFKNPIVGKTGAKVTGYVWPNKGLEYTDKNGNDRVKRISDWNFGETSEDTGRQIIHQFTVEMPDGSLRTVSAESAAKLLGISAGEVKGGALKQIRYATAIASLPEAQRSAFERKSKASGFLKPDDSVALMKDGNLRILGWRGKEDGVTDRWHWQVTTITPDGKIKTTRLATEPKTKGFELDSSDILSENVSPQATSKNDADTSNSDVAARATWTDRGGTTHVLDGFDAPSSDNVAKGAHVAVRHDNGVLYQGEIVGIGPKNVKVKTQSDMYGETVLTFPRKDIVGVRSQTDRARQNTERTEGNDVSALTAKAQALAAEYAALPDREKVSAKGRDLEQRIVEAWDAVDAAERAENAPVAAPKKTGTTTPPKAAKPAEGEKSASGATPTAPTPEMRRKATVAMRILGADAGKDAAALEAELRRMEARGQAASGPGRRRAEALRDLAAYKRAVGTKEVSAEEIADGRRQSRSKGDMPAKWTDAAKRPLERVARTLRNVVTVGGKKVKVTFADRPADVDGQTRKSIGGIYTGTVADYANRSREGGKEDGPSLQKIGTGEGTQVYGWGLYGSTLRNDAEYYAAKAQANFVPGRGSDGRQRIYEQTFFTNRPKGDESHLLAWYEPVSAENKKRIDDALMAVSGNPMDWTGVKTGEDVYRKLAEFASPKEASEFLAHNADIDGVKYPAEDHHGRTTGNGKGWNYVSFRDDNIRVDHKWIDGELRYMRNGDGEVVGEYDADRGEIRLYPGATVADVVHEFTHPLVDFARAEAKSGRGELLGKIREIINAERATWEKPVRDAYADKGEGEILEEIFTHAMGEKGATLFGKSTTTLEGRRWYNRLWEAIKGVWQDFATKMGWNKADLRGLDKMSPEAAAQKILSEMAKGRSFGDAATGRTERAGGGAKNAAAMAKTRQSKKPGDEGYLTTARYDMEDSGEYHDIDSILSEFDGDVASGRKTRFWQKIPADEYQAALRKFMREGDLFDYPESKLRDWLNRMIGNTMDLEALTEIQGHGEINPKYSIEDHYGVEFGEGEEWYDFIEKKGFDEWARLPDGSDAISDYGLRPLYSIFNELPSNPTPSEMMVAINRALDVVHARGDLSSMFIEGGRKRLSQISNDTTPDIRYSRRVTPPGGNGGGATLFSSTSPVDVNEKETFVQKVQRKIQDYRAVIKRTEEKLGITDKGRSLYYALDRVFGKTRDEAYRLAKGKVEPMLRRLVEAGAAMGKRFDATNGAEVGLDDYLYAMHAKERNDVLASRPDARVSVDGSGMSEAKAQSILSAFAAMPEAKRRAIEDAAQTVWDINDSRLDRLVASGRMSQDEADGLRRTYRHYVPLRTDMEAMGEDLFNTGTSGWTKSEFRRALGRTTEADSPTVFSLMQAEDAIAGANKNEARQRLYDMVTAHPELGRIRRMDKLTRKWSYTHGEEAWVADERYNERDRDDIVMVKRGGTLYAIELDGALGKRLAAAVTSRNLARFPDELSIIPKATRTMAEMRTQLVPTFLLRNMKADHLEVFLNSIGDMGFMGASRFLGRTERHFVSADAHKAIHQYFTTGKVDTSTDAGRLFDEYVKTGSLIGGGNRQGYADTATELNDIIDDMVRGKANPRRWGKAAKECVSTLNEHIETGTRFGVYWTCREMGMSPEEAASYSRDLTTNFNRKGEWTPVTNSLFMFSNAAIQGLARASKSMNPKMSKNAYQSLMTIGAIGVLGALWRHFLGSDDERRRKGEGDPSFDTDYDKANYIRFGWGGTSLSLKERYPWAAVKYTAEKLTEFALGDCTKGDLVKGLGENVVVAMLQEPFGHGGTAAQTVTPSVFVPITQMLEGKDFRGEDMYARKFDESKPDSSNGKRSTSGVYKGIAQGLNWLTDGNAYRQGGIDLAPETVKTVAETIGGGVWTDATRVATLLERAYDSMKSGRNEFELRDIPFLGDVVRRHRGPEAKYYEAIEAYDRDKYELKNTKDANVRRELRKDKPYLHTGKSLLDGLIERVKELGHLERGEVKAGQKWVERKTPVSEERKRRFREQRLATQARVLKMLGE